MGPRSSMVREGDALPVVYDVGGDDRAGGAGVDTPDALSAVLQQGRVGPQVEVGYDLAQQDPRAVAGR